MFRAAWICLGTIALLTTAAPAQPPKPPPSPPAPGTEVTLDGLKAVAPAAWKAEKPANRLRTYQFKILKSNGDKEDAELFIMPVIQGTVDQNLAQWKELFVPPPDSAKADAVIEGKITLGKATITTLDLRGTYLHKHIPIDQAVKEVKLDYRMLGAFWESKDARIAIRMIGPKKTVEAHAKEFDQWLKSFK